MNMFFCLVNREAQRCPEGVRRNYRMIKCDSWSLRDKLTSQIHRSARSGVRLIP